MVCMQNHSPLGTLKKKPQAPLDAEPKKTPETINWVGGARQNTCLAWGPEFDPGFLSVVENNTQDSHLI